MTKSPRVVIALSARELDLFFPDSLRTRLAALFPNAVTIDPLVETDDWTTRLVQLAPEIAITGWDSKPLPVNLPSLRYICHVTGSIRHHISRDLLERGVIVSNWGAVASEYVAEAALTMILGTMRRAQFFGDLLHRQKQWIDLPAGTQSLYDRRVGIHGFGLIARKLLLLLKPFRCEVRAFTGGIADECYAEHGIKRAESLEALFDWADVLVEAEGLTPQTRGIVTESLLRRLRPGSTFVNIARGAIVDETALARVAQEGQLRIALDVYETEPLPAASPLRGLTDNVMLFPHVGGPTEDRFPLCGEFALRNLQTYLSGGTPDALVTLEIFDRAT